MSEPIQTGAIRRESILKAALDVLKPDYDFILIDSGPSLGLLTVNALMAGDSVLIVSSPDSDSNEGTKLLIKSIQMIRRHTGHQIEVDGILMNMAAERIRALFLDGALDKDVLQEVLREQHPTPKQGKAVTFKMSGSSMQKYFLESLKKAEIAERIERALELSEIRIPQIIRQYRPETNQTEYSDILIEALQQYFSA